MAYRVRSGKMCGGVSVIRVAGDKSIAHRALWCAALARGTSTIRGLPTGHDVACTRGVIEALGASTRVVDDALLVEGCGGAWVVRQAVLDCGSSGTTLRLATGALCGTDGNFLLFTSPQLARRPMQLVIDALRELGADLVLDPAPEKIRALMPSARWPADRVPRVLIHGRPLRGGAVHLTEPSAQLKCALIFAALHAETAVTISAPTTRDHLERMLPAFGVNITVSGDEIMVQPSRMKKKLSVPLTQPSPQWERACLTSANIDIPGDPSIAAPWIAAATLRPRRHNFIIRNLSLNPTRLGLVRCLNRMGAGIWVYQCTSTQEPIGDLVISPRMTSLRPCVLSREEMPTLIDELPLLALVCAHAHGTSVLHGVAHLRGKESDRLHGVLTALRARGVMAYLHGCDTLVIHGQRAAWRRVPVAPVADDHRMTILHTLLALIANDFAGTMIRDPNAVKKSDPDFWNVLARVWPGSVYCADVPTWRCGS